MTTLIMVRHGLSTGNLEGVYCGQLDYPLAEKGFAQAELTGPYLKEHYHIDHIYSSDLARAMQTAEPTARAFGLETIPETDLREICVGEWQGQNAEMIIQTKREEMHRWRTDWSYAPKGGESFGQLKERVERFLCRVLDEHRDQTIAAFSHCGAMGLILAYCIPDREERRAATKDQDFRNASITVLRFEGRRFVDILDIGYVGHLESLATKTDGNVV